MVRSLREILRDIVGRRARFGDAAESRDQVVTPGGSVEP